MLSLKFLTVKHYSDFLFFKPGFQEQGINSINKGRDAAEELREGEMPPWFYVIGHPEAKLSGSEKDEFVQGLSATFGGEKEK